jgi:hypothetical protein
MMAKKKKLELKLMLMTKTVEHQKFQQINLKVVETLTLQKSNLTKTLLLQLLPRKTKLMTRKQLEVPPKTCTHLTTQTCSLKRYTPWNQEFTKLVQTTYSQK